MEALHSNVLVSCTKNQACALLTFSAKRLNNPTQNIWGNKKFASVIVEKLKGGLDWRFHLGFGHQFSFDADDKNSNYCIGFTYISEERRDKNIIVFQLTGKYGSVKLFSVPQLVPASHLPRIVSTIESAEPSVSKQFYAAVTLLFNPGYTLPKCQPTFDKGKVLFLKCIYLVLNFKIKVAMIRASARLWRDEVLNSSVIPTLAIRPSEATGVSAAVKAARVEDARIAAVGKEAALIQRVCDHLIHCDV
jgi:hypothetical protein